MIKNISSSKKPAQNKTGFLRTVLSLALALSLCFSLCACHGSNGMDAFEMPEEFDTSRTYEITFWAKNDTNISQVNVYKQAIEDFEALYPNIKVNLRLYTDYTKIYNDVITNISTNTTPNVCITYPDHIATYITGENVVVPLDELASNEKYGLGGSELLFDGPTRDEMVDKFYNECYVNGQLYALPYMRSTEALYINKTYVEKLGYTIPDIPTWDWIWEVSEAAMAKTTVTKEDGTTEEVFAVNGQTVMIPFIYKSTDNMMITMTKQLGSGYSTEEGEILLFNDTTKSLLYTVAEHAATGAFSTFKISSYPGNYLNAGQCIFGIDSTAGATWMGSGAGHQDISEDLIIDFETVVRPIPQFDTENPVMISQGPSICVFNKSDSQEVLASWLFAQFLLTNKVQIGYAKTEGYSPVTTKAQEDPEYVDYLSRSGEDNDLYYHVKIEATQLLIENTDNTFVTPVFNGSASLREAAGALIENAAYATRRKLTVDEDFMTKLYSDVQSLYRLDQLGTNGVTMGKKSMGALPATSRNLLLALAGAWVLIGVYYFGRKIKSKKK